MKVRYDSMSAIRYRTTSKGDLPNLPYILLKLETLETEFKTLSYSITVSLINIIGSKRRDEAQQVPESDRNN